VLQAHANSASQRSLDARCDGLNPAAGRLVPERGTTQKA